MNNLVAEKYKHTIQKKLHFLEQVSALVYLAGLRTYCRNF